MTHRMFFGPENHHRTVKRSRGTNRMLGILMHYTAGASFESDLATLSVSSRKASAHFLIGRNPNELAQIGDPTDILWHAGRSVWRHDGEELAGLNKYTIGIELCNPGFLTKVNDNTYSTYFGKHYPAHKVKPCNTYNNRGWLPYTEWQLTQALNLCEDLVKAYPSIQFIVGHEDVSPGRKQDPGNDNILSQAFYDQVAEIIEDRNIEAEDKYTPPEVEAGQKYVIQTSGARLNVRDAASSRGTIVTKLRAGTEVQGLGRNNGWLQIEIPGSGSKGWVYGAYVYQIS